MVKTTRCISTPPPAGCCQLVTRNPSGTESQPSISAKTLQLSSAVIGLAAAGITTAAAATGGQPPIMRLRSVNITAAEFGIEITAQYDGTNCRGSRHFSPQCLEPPLYRATTQLSRASRRQIAHSHKKLFVAAWLSDLQPGSTGVSTAGKPGSHTKIEGFSHTKQKPLSCLVLPVSWYCMKCVVGKNMPRH